MIDAFRRLSKKLNHTLFLYLSNKLLENLNPTIHKSYLEGTEEFFSVPDGVKRLISELNLANDDDFLANSVGILKKVISFSKIDEEKAILAYEPVLYILDDIFSKSSSNKIAQHKKEIIKLIKSLPNEYAASVTRLLAILKKSDNENFPTIEAEIVKLQATIEKVKRWTTKKREEVFENLKAITNELYRCSYATNTVIELHDLELNQLLQYFSLTQSYISFVKNDIDEGEIEEFFQIVGEALRIYSNEIVFDEFLNLALIIEPQYSSFHFLASEQFFAWFIKQLEIGIEQQNPDAFRLAVYALDESEFLQTRFSQYSSLFCKLLDIYAQKNKNYLNNPNQNYSISIEGLDDESFSTARKTFTKITEFNRTISNSSWTESDKKIVLDYVLNSNLKDLYFFKYQFIPALLGTDFNLFQKKYWNIIHDFSKSNQLIHLFKILRNRQIFNFSSNIKEIKSIWQYIKLYIKNNIEDSYFEEHPANLIEIASRSLVLVYKNRNGDYANDAYELSEDICDVLLNKKVQQYFKLEEVKGALYGDDLYCYILAFMFTDNARLKVVSNYAKYFKNHPRERREFIEGLVELLYSNKGFDDIALDKIKPILGDEVIENIYFLIEEKGYNFRFDKKQFEKLLQ